MVAQIKVSVMFLLELALVIKDFMELCVRVKKHSSAKKIYIRLNIKLISTDMQCPGDGYCSNQGICDVSTGTCTCDSGFQGDMCQGTGCLRAKWFFFLICL